MEELEQRLLQELSVEKAWDNLKSLAEVGERLAGSPFRIKGKTFEKTFALFF